MHSPFTLAQRRNLHTIRSALLITSVVLVVFPSVFQPILDRVWALLLRSTIYRASIWETLLTIGSYAAIEAFYTSLVTNPSAQRSRIDMRSSRSHMEQDGTPLLRPYSQRRFELLAYAGPLLALDLVMVKKFVGVQVEDIIRSGGYDLPVPVPVLPSAAVPSPLGLASSLAAPSGAANFSSVTMAVDSLTRVAIRTTWKVPTLHRFTRTDPVQLVRALPPAAPSSRDIVFGVIGALVLYDFLFFIPHIAMHKIRWLWHLHVPHHQHAEIHPQITNQLSITERLTLLLAANLSLHLLHAHPLTRTIFVPIFLYLLVENHCGLDLPYGYHRILPAGWASGPEEHAEHHRSAKLNFQPYLTWADKLLGTHSTRRPSGHDDLEGAGRHRKSVIDEPLID